MLPRVLEYSSTTRVIFTTRVFVNFYFRLQIPFQVADFLQSVDELLEFMETLGFGISFGTCHRGNRSEYRSDDESV